MRTLIAEIKSDQVRHTGGFMTILELSGAEMEREGDIVKVYYEVLDVEVMRE